VGAKQYQDLVAWQLANELRRAVFQATIRGPASRDLRFCDQIRAASSSVSANIAEGFYRYTHREFARFLRIARGSLGETQNYLEEARDRGYITDRDFQSLWRLSVRAMVATTRLMTYLRKQPDPS
jgi:four helix bundle protein